jgi:hypothetical protein
VTLPPILVYNSVLRNTAPKQDYIQQYKPFMLGEAKR